MINGIICVAGPFCFSSSVISPKVSVVPSVLAALSEAFPDMTFSRGYNGWKLEDTMFSKADAKEMETRMEKRAEAMKKRMDVQFFITTSISLGALFNSLR